VSIVSSTAEAITITAAAAAAAAAAVVTATVVNAAAAGTAAGTAAAALCNGSAATAVTLQHIITTMQTQPSFQLGWHICSERGSSTAQHRSL
jgi:hypothetical protein